MTTIYRFLTGPDTSEFCHKVTKALSQGWRLHGDPQYCHDPTSGEMRCGQAVVKEVDAAYDPQRRLGEY
ncbi:MAG: DUF1737 domain-containing protein [Nitratireductor sp.]|nr:DUF1737 domain-containing protein [Nitratireductor sp.]